MATVCEFPNYDKFSARPVPSPSNRAVNQVSRSNGRPGRAFVRIAPYILDFLPSRQLTAHRQPTMLKLHKESDFHLPQSQNCLLGSVTVWSINQNSCAFAPDLLLPGPELLKGLRHLDYKIPLRAFQLKFYFFTKHWQLHPLTCDSLHNWHEFMYRNVNGNNSLCLALGRNYEGNSSYHHHIFCKQKHMSEMVDMTDLPCAFVDIWNRWW